MRDGLEVGSTSQLTFRVPATKTVRHIYPEAKSFQAFPEVFATGFFVALVEWACVEALAPYLEPGEGSLGIGVQLSHDAPTPPGFEVTVSTTVTAVEGRTVTWDVEADDGVDLIGRGSHTRGVILREKFDRRVAAKLATLDEG